MLMATPNQLGECRQQSFNTSTIHFNKLTSNKDWGKEKEKEKEKGIGKGKVHRMKEID